MRNRKIISASLWCALGVIQGLLATRGLFDTIQSWSQSDKTKGKFGYSLYMTRFDSNGGLQAWSLELDRAAWSTVQKMAQNQIQPFITTLVLKAMANGRVKGCTKFQADFRRPSKQTLTHVTFDGVCSRSFIETKGQT